MTHSHRASLIFFSPTPSVSRIMIAGFLGSVLLLGSGTAFADRGHQKHYKHDPQSQMEYLSKKFQLTHEQQDRILPILEEKHQKLNALHNQMKVIRQETMEKIQAELTPEQQKLWHDHHEGHKNNKKDCHKKPDNHLHDTDGHQH